MADRIIVYKNDVLYTLADIKDYFRNSFLAMQNGTTAGVIFKRYADAADAAMKKLMDADMVKVVRCGDCVHWEPPTDIEADDGCTAGHCRWNYGSCQNQQTDMTWFCADGERGSSDSCPIEGVDQDG